MFVFSYTVMLHLLIFAILMRWSHRHSTSIKDLVALCAKQVTLTLPSHPKAFWNDSQIVQWTT